MSRTDARSTSLRHRPPRTVPATIVAVLLLLLGIGLVWIAVLKLTNDAWPSVVGSASSFLSGLTWASSVALAIAIAVAVLGVVLLVAALAPGTPNAIMLGEPAASEGRPSISQSEYVMTRRSVGKLAAAHADLVDGVDKVAVTTSARQVKLQVTSASEKTSELEKRVTGQVRDALSAAGLTPLPRVSTTARTTKP